MPFCHHLPLQIRKALTQPLSWFPIASIALLSLLIILCVITGHWIRAEIIDQKGRELAVTAEALGIRIDRILFERVKGIKMLSTDTGLYDSNFDSIRNTLQQYQAAHGNAYVAIGLADRHGHVLASTDEELVGDEISELQLYQSIQRNRPIEMKDVTVMKGKDGTLAMMLGTPLTSPLGATGRPRMVFAYVPVRSVVDQLDGQSQIMHKHNSQESTIEWQLFRHDGRVLVDSILGEAVPSNLGQENLST
ncbi:MAG: hypothetical protein ACPGYT_15200, partial [Nitrospirales bacterium]